MGKVFKHIDKPLLITTIILFIIGLIMVFSSSNVTAYMTKYVSPYHYFINQGVFLVLGLFLFLIMVRFNTKFYGYISWGLMFIFIALLAILLVVGKAQNQAVSWFDLGYFSLQPSEFIKIIAILFLAGFYEERKNRLDSPRVVLFSLGLCGIPAALIMIQPDLGTTIIYSLIVAAVFYAQPFSTLTKFKTTSYIIGGVVIVLLTAMFLGKNILLERQQSRIDNMSRPCDRLLTDGNQVCNGYIAINNGGLFGKGLGNSTQKYLYLPEPYTDFIFTIMIEEMGALFGIAIILMYIFVLYRILAIGRKSYTNRGTTICYGVAVYIFLHIAINLMGIMGLMPMTGVPLPFMSYGGSFTICLIAALTAVQRVSVESGIRKEISK